MRVRNFLEKKRITLTENIFITSDGHRESRSRSSGEERENEGSSTGFSIEIRKSGKKETSLPSYRLPQMKKDFALPISVTRRISYRYMVSISSLIPSGIIVRVLGLGLAQNATKILGYHSKISQKSMSSSCLIITMITWKSRP